MKFCISLLLFSSALYALEPLVDKTAERQEKQVRRLIAKGDKDGDGNIHKKENKVIWGKYGKSDENKDAMLDVSELRKAFAKRIDSPGEKILNIRYKETPQGSVYLDFYYPDEDTNKEKPVVVFTHGGGWAAGNKTKASHALFNTVHRALLKEGFCVMSVGYRLIKNEETAIRDCVVDCKDAVRFISAHKNELGIDPEKIYTFGDSAGGHLAQMLLLSPPETFTGDPELAKYSYKVIAGVSWYGPCDFQDIQLFNPDESEDFEDRFGPRIMSKDSSPSDKEARYKEVSPIVYLTDKSAPLLMIQGDRDTTIPVKQAYRMKKELKSVAAPVEIMIVKNSGHNWRDVKAPITPTKREIVEKTVSFLLKHKK